MLEGVVYRVLLGYLGRYVKHFSRDQLNISKRSLRNILAVELKDIELILEAFDYLLFPFALKQGRVGKLSVKVLWGKEPIHVALEDVFLVVSPRDENDCSKDAVERRELKGWWSFISYLTSKVLENIQVSVKNSQVMFTNMHSDSGSIAYDEVYRKALTWLDTLHKGIRLL